MNEHLIGGQRRLPLHAPVQQHAAVPDTAQNNVLQEVAAASADVQVHAPSPSEDFTISVDQVRDHFRSKGLSKSKDTIQRWCRNGDLTCQKRGVLGRYFTTESSLKALEQKLLPDMIADGSGEDAASDGGMQVREAAVEKDVQVHTAEDADECTSVQLHAGEDAAARSDMQQTMHSHAGASDSTQLAEATQLAALRAEVAGLEGQLEQAQSMNSFLQEEVASSRSQRGDVVDISKQMLATLETIAVGGRLDKPAAPPQADQTDPVRYQQVDSDPSAV